MWECIELNLTEFLWTTAALLAIWKPHWPGICFSSCPTSQNWPLANHNIFLVPVTLCWLLQQVQKRMKVFHCSTAPYLETNWSSLTRAYLWGIAVSQMPLFKVLSQAVNIELGHSFAIPIFRFSDILTTQSKPRPHDVMNCGGPCVWEQLDPLPHWDSSAVSCRFCTLFIPQWWLESIPSLTCRLALLSENDGVLDS